MPRDTTSYELPIKPGFCEFARSQLRPFDGAFQYDGNYDDRTAQKVLNEWHQPRHLTALVLWLWDSGRSVEVLLQGTGDYVVIWHEISGSMIACRAGTVIGCISDISC